MSLFNVECFCEHFVHVELSELLVVSWWTSIDYYLVTTIFWGASVQCFTLCAAVELASHRICKSTSTDPAHQIEN
eukprot:2836982-Amphidinium_carterae.1